jgi:signal transduction histidine kinase
VRAPRLSRLTARNRLTLLYAGLFLVLGTVTLAIVFGVSSHGSAIVVSPVTGRPVPGQLVTPAIPPLDQAQAAVLQQRAADQARLLKVSWLVLLIATGLAALLGWIAAGRVLAPLRTMTATARTISAGSLHQRLALHGPDDEFQALGDTLDQLFARLQASFDAQRRFVANASHELRTPLTLDRTLLQVALADGDATAATLRATCEELLSSNTDQARLLEALLTLATSEAGPELRAPVDLALVCAELVDAAAAESGRRGIDVSTELAPAPAGGDPALVRRLVGNLLDNALQYNVDGGTVEIRTFTQDGRGSVSIANSGPPIPAAEVASLFEPFRRLGTQRIDAGAEHHGLGLSIVHAIATAHGATLTAAPRDQGGLTVTVTFPAPAP